MKKDASKKTSGLEINKKRYQKPILKKHGNIETVARELSNGVLAASDAMCW